MSGSNAILSSCSNRRVYDLGIANKAQLKAIDDEAKQEVAEAVTFAEESPQPDPSELYDNVYYEAPQDDTVHDDRDDKVVPLSSRSRHAG